MHWSDGSVNYAKLSDYTWTYKKNETLQAVFKSNSPVGPGGGGGGSGGGGGGGSGGGSMPGPVNGQQINNYVTNTLSGNNIYNNTPYGKWVNELPFSQDGLYRYEVNEATTVDIVNKEFEVVNIGFKKYLSNGIYRIIDSSGKGYYYLFDSNGIMQTGFKTLNGKIYYFEETGENKGAMVQGEKVINGILHKFNPDGSLIIENNILQVVNGLWFYLPSINKWEYYVQGLNGVTVKLTNGTFAIKDETQNFTNYEFDEFGFLKNN